MSRSTVDLGAVAALVRVELDAEERRTLLEELGALVEHIETLGDPTPPVVQRPESPCPLREDRVRPAERDSLLDAAPREERGWFYLPPLDLP